MVKKIVFIATHRGVDNAVQPPEDMLRYDKAEVLNKISDGKFELSGEKLTIGRWNSFGWDVEKKPKTKMINLWPN